MNKYFMYSNGGKAMCKEKGQGCIDTDEFFNLAVKRGMGKYNG